MHREHKPLVFDFSVPTVNMVNETPCHPERTPILKEARTGLRTRNVQEDMPPGKVVAECMVGEGSLEEDT
jgi:hypothetical protein